MTTRTSSLLAAGVLCGVLATSEMARADVKACLDAAESAQTRRREGKLLEAKSQLISCSAPACPAQVRNDCVRWLSEVEAALPSILLRAQDESGRELVNATFELDGGRAASDGKPIVLDPGRHVLRATASGATATEDLIVRQSEHDRIVTIRVVSSKPSAEHEKPRAFPLPAYVLAGAGVALLATGAVLGILGAREHDDLEETCAKTSSCLHDDVVRARTKLIAGDVLMGTGLVAIGVGVVLALTGSKTASVQGRGATTLLRF